jgi:hypothetical protein
MLVNASCWDFRQGCREFEEKILKNTDKISHILPKPVEFVFSGALVPLLLDDGRCGKFFHAQ